MVLFEMFDLVFCLHKKIIIINLTLIISYSP
jgi:hypothetical protein